MANITVHSDLKVRWWSDVRPECSGGIYGNWCFNHEPVSWGLLGHTVRGPRVTHSGESTSQLSL